MRQSLNNGFALIINPSIVRAEQIANGLGRPVDSLRFENFVESDGNLICRNFLSAARHKQPRSTKERGEQTVGRGSAKALFYLQ